MILEASYDEVLKVRLEVMYPDKNIEYVKLPSDNLGLHMGNFVENQLVTVTSLFLEGRDLQFRKLATLKDFQNKGYATELIKWILDYAKEFKLNKVWCNSRVDKISFYEKFGFVKTDNIFTKDGIDFIIMEKTSF